MIFVVVVFLGLVGTFWYFLGYFLLQIGPPGGATCINCKLGHQVALQCIGSKFGNQMAQPALVPNLIIMWCNARLQLTITSIRIVRDIFKCWDFLGIWDDFLKMSTGSHVKYQKCEIRQNCQNLQRCPKSKKYNSDNSVQSHKSVDKVKSVKYVNSKNCQKCQKDSYHTLCINCFNFWGCSSLKPFHGLECDCGGICQCAGLIPFQ